MRAATALLCIALVSGACGDSSREQRIVIAAGTTLTDSGLLEVLAERFESETGGVRVSIVGEASAQVIELGRNGAADMLITHAPRAEEAFIAEGGSALDLPVFVSRFVLLGPVDEVGRFDGLGAADAFAGVAGQGLTFVTRADGSGTYERELAIWEMAGIEPEGEWLIATGQGMGLTLQVADQRDAFVLAEYGSYLAARSRVDLVPVALAPGDELDNLYRAIIVAGGAEAQARDFLNWLVSPPGLNASRAANIDLFGEVVYAQASRAPTVTTTTSPPP